MPQPGNTVISTVSGKCSHPKIVINSENKNWG